jgi:hypothetical protein
MILFFQNLKNINKNSKFNVYKFLYNSKYGLETAETKTSILPVTVNTSKHYSDIDITEVLPLTKSKSMNVLTFSTSKSTLKRSKSELNLYGQEKTIPQLIFNSTSSIATVVNNKPSTYNKLIQTSIKTCAQEFLGVQVSILKASY